MSKTHAGARIGAVVGFLLGTFGYLGFFYVVYMLPDGTSFRHIDQGAIPIVITAPLGTVIGCLIGALIGKLASRRGPYEPPVEQ